MTNERRPLSSIGRTGTGRRWWVSCTIRGCTAGRTKGTPRWWPWRAAESSPGSGRSASRSATGPGGARHPPDGGGASPGPVRRSPRLVPGYPGQLGGPPGVREARVPGRPFAAPIAAVGSPRAPGPRPGDLEGAPRSSPGWPGPSGGPRAGERGSGGPAAPVGRVVRVPPPAPMEPPERLPPPPKGWRDGRVRAPFPRLPAGDLYRGRAELTRARGPAARCHRTPGRRTMARSWDHHLPGRHGERAPAPGVPPDRPRARRPDGLPSGGRREPARADPTRVPGPPALLPPAGLGLTSRPLPNRHGQLYGTRRPPPGQGPHGPEDHGSSGNIAGELRQGRRERRQHGRQDRPPPSVVPGDGDGGTDLGPEGRGVSRHRESVLRPRGVNRRGTSGRGL